MSSMLDSQNVSQNLSEVIKERKKGNRATIMLRSDSEPEENCVTDKQMLLNKHKMWGYSTLTPP